MLFLEGFELALAVFLSNLVNPPTKSSWNKSVGTTINKYYINQMVKDAENKSLLKLLHLSEELYLFQ
jgi:hypothetical protein